MKIPVFLFLILLSFQTSLFAQNQYKVTLLRAAPGDLLELIELVKQDIENHEEFGIQKPYLMRHSQGDHWDLMLMYPINGISDHFDSEKIAARQNSNTFDQPFGSDFHTLISFQEEAIVLGPDHSQFIEWFEKYGFFHIEIFTALAGKQKELLKQREDENVFYAGINHKGNMIFTREWGPSWDIFTIGAYYNLQDYADDGGITFEQEDSAAKEAGFEGVNFIGSYLRSLLLHHHDTLARKVD